MSVPGSRAALPGRWRATLAAVLFAVAGWYALLTWETGFAPGELPTRQISRPTTSDRILLFAPHEDDESIAAAGYLTQAMATGAEVHVCLLTNGEGEELGAAWTSRSLRLTPAKFVQLGQRRQQETLSALAQVGVSPDHVIFLGYPNMGLDRMLSATNWDYQHPHRSPFLRTTTSPYPTSYTAGATFCGARLLADLRSVLQTVHPTRIFTCHPADVHHDHWPAYSFVRLALDTIAQEPHGAWVDAVPVYTYLVHRPGFPQPFGMAPDAALAAPPSLQDLALNTWLSLPLSPADRTAKRAMLSLYRSQATAFDLLIRSFIRTNELFATIPLLALGTAPPGDAARPLELEPVGDLAYLRRQPGADIAAVEAAATGAEVVLRVHLAQTPAARTTTSVLIAVPLTSAHHLQALQVDCTPGQPATLTAATSHWRLGAGDLGGVTALVAGNTVRVVIPLSAFDGCDRFSVTAVTVTGSRVRDHSMARTYRLPHQQVP